MEIIIVGSLRLDDHLVPSRTQVQIHRPVSVPAFGIYRDGFLGKDPADMRSFVEREGQGAIDGLRGQSVVRCVIFVKREPTDEGEADLRSDSVKRFLFAGKSLETIEPRAFWVYGFQLVLNLVEPLECDREATVCVNGPLCQTESSPGSLLPSVIVSTTRLSLGTGTSNK